jgi:large subunit ribosomal protein L21
MTGEKMRYAIVESGGKQYKAVEGQTIEVDRLAVKEGVKVDLLALLMADDDEITVGTPTVSGIQVKATVTDHFRGEKVIRFKYSPKKRIRVRGGHRQQYTRLMVDFIGKPGETRKAQSAKPQNEEIVESGTKAKIEKPSPAKKETATSTKKKSSAVKSSEKKSSTSSSPKGKKSSK